MSTGIQWTDKTWNPIVGCRKVSPGCFNCYAERTAARLAKNPNPKVSERYADTIDERGHWSGKMVLASNDVLHQPLYWRNKPRFVFVCSMSDLFVRTISFDDINRVFSVIAKCPNLTFQILTKRPESMFRYFHKVQQPLSNVWIGVSVETPEFLYRIDMLREIMPALSFVSFEPLLEEMPWDSIDMTGIGWAIFGGESGPNARGIRGRGGHPIHAAEHAKQFIDAMRRQHVTPFVKQLGSEWAQGRALDRKGGDPAEWPEDIRVREFPK